MRHRIKRLTLNRETVRTLASYQLARIAGAQSQGGACDNTAGKTQCEVAGCALVCSDSCQICDTLTWQGGTCTTP